MEPITLDSLCSTVNLSPSYVIKLFNHYTSLSPMAYVNRVRIEAAREMLAETPLSVSDIAAQTGFKDSFYFSKKFKVKAYYPYSARVSQMICISRTNPEPQNHI